MKHRFEHHAERNDNEDRNDWKDVNEVRRSRPVSGQYASWSEPTPFQAKPMPRDRYLDPVNAAAAGQDPPTWSDQREQVLVENGGMPFVAAGESDDSGFPTAKELQTGVCRLAMPRKEQHEIDGNPGWYEEIRGHDDDSGYEYGGFLERGNVADRH